MYDCRFNGHSGWGYGTGLFLGEIYSKRVDAPATEVSPTPYIPFEINYLSGQKKHHFEFAAGMLLTYLNHEYVYGDAI